MPLLSSYAARYVSMNLVDARWRDEVGAGEDQVFRRGQVSSQACKKSLFNDGVMGFMNSQEFRASRDRQLSSHPARSITTSSCRFLVFRSHRRRKSWQTVVPHRSSHSRAVCGTVARPSTNYINASLWLSAATLLQTRHEIPGFLQPIQVWILDAADFLACLLLGKASQKRGVAKAEIHQPMSPRCVAT